MNTKRKSEMQHKTIVGNWKMYTTAVEARELAEGIINGIVVDDRISVTLCPPFPYLALIAGIIKGSRVALGAQNLYPKEEGAYTGEVSAKMLLDVGCKYVILGHSERRHKLGESDAFINQKVRFALAAGLDVILCVGETLEQRNSNQTEVLLDGQIIAGLAGVSKASLSCLSIAYEPVWAIGNAEHHATPEQAQEAHAIIRRRLRQLFDETSADAIPIQYGGSVKPDNAASFLSRPGINGALIGGASLHADQFLAIIRAATDATYTDSHSAARDVVAHV
jgi:triosephosphate isomerase